MLTEKISLSQLENFLLGTSNNRAKGEEDQASGTERAKR